MNSKVDYDILYRTFKLDNKLEYDGMTLVPGYYRFKYTIASENKIEHPFEFSEDGIVKWVPVSDLGEVDFGRFNEICEFVQKNDAMVFDKGVYAHTVIYKGYSVPIFVDDYGQCFYCVFNNKEISFGSYNMNIDDDVKYLIDEDIERKGN